MSSHLQGNAGRSCLLLWNAKNVASPKHGPCHTYNAKWTTKDSKHGRYSTVFKVDYKILTSFIHMMLDTVNIMTNRHLNTLTGLHLDRRRSALNVHLFESSLNFLQLQQDPFYVPNWKEWPVNFRAGHGVSVATVSMVTGHLLVTDNGLASVLE